jgi:hypothetical protein
MSARISDDLTDKIAELSLRYSARRIAVMLNVSHTTISNRAKECGIAMPRPREAYLMAMKDVAKSDGALAANRRRHIPVPKWCPAFFAEEYREYGMTFGEELAAGHLRRLLAEMRAAA